MHKAEVCFLILNLLQWRNSSNTTNTTIYLVLLVFLFIPTTCLDPISGSSEEVYTLEHKPSESSRHTFH